MVYWSRSDDLLKGHLWQSIDAELEGMLESKWLAEFAENILHCRVLG